MDLGIVQKERIIQDVKQNVKRTEWSEISGQLPEQIRRLTPSSLGVCGKVNVWVDRTGDSGV